MVAEPIAPPAWTPADEAALRRALEAAGPSEVPKASFDEYLLDLGAWLRDLFIDLVGRALPWDDTSWLERLALWVALGAAVVAALVVLAVALRRRRRRAATSEVTPLAAPPPEASAGADWWAGELARRLEAGSLRGALEALWWWVARRVDPPGLDPSWTTGELLRASRKAVLREPLRRLERLQWSTAEPRRDEVESLARNLREALP